MPGIRGRRLAFHQGNPRRIGAVRWRGRKQKNAAVRDRRVIVKALIGFQFAAKQ
jgi:hypothetical protein